MDFNSVKIPARRKARSVCIGLAFLQPPNHALFQWGSPRAEVADCGVEVGLD